MKKIIFIIGFLFVSLITIAQDVVIFKHTNYTSHFSKSKSFNSCIFSIKILDNGAVSEVIM